MDKTQNIPWFHYPPIVLPSPILGLTAGKSGIWAGGAGGVAWYPIHSDWETRITGLSLSAVAALASHEGILLAGGNGGIAYSENGGELWHAAETPEDSPAITALLLSPHYPQDKTALAATLANGILRSDDGGRVWHAATLGLQNFDITSLIWAGEEVVLAGTISGIYRSTDGGRAWKLAKDTERAQVAALAYLPDATLLAALENGGLLASTDGGFHWNEYGSLPDEVQGTALLVTESGTLLLGTIEHGILRSTDKGRDWHGVHDENVFSFASCGQTLYAGTVNELCASVDDGETWISLPHPPIHDLRQLFIDKDLPLLAGTYAGLLHFNEMKQAWVPLIHTPRPLSAAAIAPDGDYLVSIQEGLQRSTDGGTTWESVLDGEEGQLARITFLADGSGWAGSADGTRLFNTADSGLHWETVQAPFGALPLAALQVLPGQLVAATYDPQQHRAYFWRTLDNGQSWQAGIEAEITWPIVATWQNPAILTLGAQILIQDGNDQWRQEIVGNGQEPVWRIVGNTDILFALTTGSLLQSKDNGKTWTKEENTPSATQILDLTVSNQKLYMLLMGGQLWSRIF